ncbi:YccF domain-containing protein [Corynebacterium sp. TAE3-ERU12]|uniref:YccF domain-containing protein n=1 Tax=Corynebacterium sp. TAE3-ERU12 TaxID=2849491 RepID=UPI001C4505FF|nr:YccF domain-containing protein [Corynebacterium sp. TAE3-ERU12]MBV7294773.1 YccF domain-containing protein [Corynebacterium sp. TAE3-ERU12]
MKTLLNIIWLLTGGIFLALGYMVAGVIACIGIITIPVGIASFRMASYALWPFGRSVVESRPAGGATILMNIVWFVIAGVWLAATHLATALAQAVTIIGLPLAWANLKMIPVTCFPFGKTIVDDAAVGFDPFNGRLQR